jgi:hypothetical protein
MISTSIIISVIDNVLFIFDNKDVGLVVRRDMLYLPSHSDVVNVLDTPIDGQKAHGPKARHGAR